MDPVILTATHHFPAGARLAASTSPLRSPSRRQRLTSQEKIPFLSDLSPSATLEALQANDLVRIGDDPHKSFIQESAASASTLERAWGIKATVAGKKVQEWFAEIGAWIWPGFDRPPLGEQYHEEGLIREVSPSEAFRPSGSSRLRKDAFGALSPKLVSEYEERIESVREELETLEIEDLKDYVRHTHHKAGSRRSSLLNPQENFGLMTEYDHLDDFTAIITATIMQALPTISRLEALLNTWSTRLLVLRQVPSFLVGLNSGQESMLSASIAVDAQDSQPSNSRSDLSRKAFLDIRALLQDEIAELGRMLDRMLDLLEGSADTLPDAWIDGLDEMENQYSTWVVKAERLVINKEMRNERLEKDYTQDRTNELLDLDGPLDTQHTKSNSDVDTRFDEVRRRTDSDFDLTLQNPTETLKTESAVTDSPTESSAESFDLEPLPSQGAFPNQVLRHETKSRAPMVKSADSALLDGVSAKLLALSSAGRPGHRPTPLVLAGSRENAKRPDSSDTDSDTSDSMSSTSNYSSNKSSPEIQSAVIAEYMGSPVRVTSPAKLNKEPTTAAEIARRRLGPPAKGYGVRIDQSSVPSDMTPTGDRRKRGAWHFRARRASLQPFEMVPKHEIKKVQVRRSGSYSSALSLSDPEYDQAQLTQLPHFFGSQHREPEALRTTKPLPASRDQQSSAQALNQDLRADISKQQLPYHPPPPVPPKLPASAQSLDQDFHPPRHQLPYHPPPAVSPGSTLLTQNSDRELDLAKQRLPYHSPPPIQHKSVHRFEEVSDLSPGSTPVVIRQMKKANSVDGEAVRPVETPQKAAGVTSKNFDDQLEERISSILTELPTEIRLTSGPEPDAPEVTRFNPSAGPRTPKARLPAWRLKKAQTSTTLPSMTLAPAQPKSSSSRSPTAEPDIKLYHLHQAGKTAPVKLFVRLVGEGGERVMVRIGGGWADLGEYLREYAGHHGRRSVSESPFDITGLPSSSPLTNNNNNPSPRSRPASRPISPTTSSSTKESPANANNNRLSRQQTSPSTFTVPPPRTPQSDPSAQRTTSSRMSWAAGTTTTTDEVSPFLGLAGPKTKNVDISPRKQAWVDEMMEQARQGGTAAAEKENKGGAVVGDLGKVGRTKRVFFRHRKDV